MTDGFAELLGTFTSALEQAEPDRFAGCFAEDATYHDEFYGERQGRAAIRSLVADTFLKDARDFRWTMIEPVSAGDLGYSYWILSYVPMLKHYESKRVVFEGTSRFHLRDGLIHHYAETANGGLVMAQLGVDAERMKKSFTRAAAAFREREAVRKHLEGLSEG